MGLREELKRVSFSSALDHLALNRELGALIPETLAKKGVLTSAPPSGMCRILNIYWDPVSEKAIFEYDDEPVE